MENQSVIVVENSTKEASIDVALWNKEDFQRKEQVVVWA